MPQLLHAGIVAARRQLAALVIFTLVLLFGTDCRELFAVNHTTSTVGMSSSCVWICINQLSIDRGYRTPYSPRIRSLPSSWSEARVDGTHSSVWPCRDPACNIGAARAAQHNNRCRRIFWSRLGRFNH